MTDVGMILKRRTSFPPDTGFCAWLVLDKYDPDDCAPSDLTHPDAIEVLSGVSEKEARDLCEKLKELIGKKGFNTAIATAFDVSAYQMFFGK